MEYIYQFFHSIPSWILATIPSAATVLGGVFLFERNRKKTAIDKFHNAFAQAIARLKCANGSNAGETIEFLGQSILLHAAAIEEFRPFARNGTAYEKACESYLSCIRDIIQHEKPQNKATSILKVILQHNDIENFYSNVADKINAILSCS